MAFTNLPNSRDTDAVRVLVGDISTSTSYEYLSDASYVFFIAQTPNLYSAASLACNSLAAFFANAGSEKKVGDLILRRQLSKDYRGLYIQYKTMAAKNISPYAGGLSRSDKQSVESDTDRQKPAFTRNQLDNRYALDPLRSTST